MILAIDASQPKGAVALYDDQLVFEYILEDSNHVATLRAAFEVRPDVVCLGVGPGRVTGVRSAASFVAGYAQAQGCRVMTLPSPLILASAAHIQDGVDLCQVVIDARLGQFYVANYRFSSGVVEVLAEPYITDVWPQAPYVCGMDGNLSSRLDAVFETMPVGKALACYDIWQKSGCLSSVEPEAIDLLYVRAAVGGV